MRSPSREPSTAGTRIYRRHQDLPPAPGRIPPSGVRVPSRRDAGLPGRLRRASRPRDRPVRTHDRDRTVQRAGHRSDEHRAVCQCPPRVLGRRQRLLTHRSPVHRTDRPPRGRSSMTPDELTELPTSIRIVPCLLHCASHPRGVTCTTIRRRHREPDRGGSERILTWQLRWSARSAPSPQCRQYGAPSFPVIDIYRIFDSSLIGMCRSLSNWRSSSTSRPSVVR